MEGGRVVGGWWELQPEMQRELVTQECRVEKARLHGAKWREVAQQLVLSMAQNRTNNLCRITLCHMCAILCHTVCHACPLAPPRGAPLRCGFYKRLAQTAYLRSIAKRSNQFAKQVVSG